ncbi:MAG: hypothetical protein AB7V04_03780 [Desulfomonilaceae bacterium]
MMEKTIKMFWLLAMLGILISECQAQWPLGKELPQQSLKSAESGIAVSGSGRHQIFVSPNIKGHTFMIDTDTGNIWMFKKDSTSGDYSLQRVPVEKDGKQSGESARKGGSGAHPAADK